MKTAHLVLLAAGTGLGLALLLGGKSASATPSGTLPAGSIVRIPSKTLGDADLRRLEAASPQDFQGHAENAVIRVTGTLGDLVTGTVVGAEVQIVGIMGLRSTPFPGGVVVTFPRSAILPPLVMALPPAPPAIPQPPAPLSSNIVPIPANTAVFVSRDADPPAAATTGPSNVIATFDSLKVSTAITTTIAVGTVRQGTLLARVTVSTSTPNPSGGGALLASLTDTFTVVWVSPDAQRIAFVYDATVGMRNGMDLGPSGLLIAHH